MNATKEVGFGPPLLFSAKNLHYLWSFFIVPALLRRESDQQPRLNCLSSNNLQLTAGRQCVAEGVAAERIDGLPWRSDRAAGFGAAVLGGAPVATKPNFKGRDLTYGGRIFHRMPKYGGQGAQNRLEKRPQP